jgi:hypothetical protein
MTLAWADFRKSFLHIVILGGVFLIPLVWSRYLNANYVSAKFFLVYLISSLSLLVSSRQWLWPELPKPLLFSVLAIIALHLISPAISGDVVHVLYMFKFLSFSFFAYYFYTLKIDINSFLKKFDLVLLLVAGAIFGFACNDFYLYRIEKSDITSVFLLGSFGNVNMLAEFFILSLPMIHLWRHSRALVPSFLKDLLFFGWIFFILYCRSRSAWIGLGLWGIWSLANKKLSWTDFGLIIAAFVCYQASLLAPHVQDIAVAVKGESFRQRLHLYQTTLKLIADNPFGVGVGQYFNEIVPYLVNSDFRPVEYVYFDQPHSEILKWAVQFGWVGFVLPPVIFGYLAYYAFRQKNFFLTASLAVLGPQVAFQFPFENPGSLMYLAFVFSLALSLFPIAKEKYIQFKYRIPVFVFSLVGVAHAFAFVTGIFLETSHNGNVVLAEKACELYPVSLNGCFVRDQFLIGTNRLVQGRLALKEDLERFPYHAGLMRILPAYLKTTGSDQLTCEAVLMYDFVYENQTFFKENVLQTCHQYKLPITYYTPVQFRDDYNKWLESVFPK